MSLELGSRFRLPDGRLVEVVPDMVEILKLDQERGTCGRCAAYMLSIDECVAVGCLNHETARMELATGYPRILKEVEDDVKTKG